MAKKYKHPDKGLGKWFFEHPDFVFFLIEQLWHMRISILRSHPTWRFQQFECMIRPSCPQLLEIVSARKQVCVHKTKVNS